MDLPLLQVRHVVLQGEGNDQLLTRVEGPAVGEEAQALAVDEDDEALLAHLNQQLDAHLQQLGGGVAVVLLLLFGVADPLLEGIPPRAHAVVEGNLFAQLFSSGKTGVKVQQNVVVVEVVGWADVDSPLLRPLGHVHQNSQSVVLAQLGVVLVVNYAKVGQRQKNA